MSRDGKTGRARRGVRAEATGRSFLKMMVLVVLATGFAVFWVVRSQARQRAEMTAAGSQR
jgi:preprotein translocase subunit YajC